MPGAVQLSKPKAHTAVLLSLSCKDGVGLCAGQKLQIQYVGKVHLKQCRVTTGDIKNAMIKQRVAKWHAIFSGDLPTPPALLYTNRGVDIDVGVIDAGALADNRALLAHGYFVKRGQLGLRIAQRSGARKKKSSNSRRKAMRFCRQPMQKPRISVQICITRRRTNGNVNMGASLTKIQTSKDLAGEMLAKHVLKCGWKGALAKLTYKTESAGW